MRHLLQQFDVAPYALATILALGANFAWLGAILAGSVFVAPWLDMISNESACSRQFAHCAPLHR